MSRILFIFLIAIGLKNYIIGHRAFTIGTSYQTQYQYAQAF